MSSRWWNVVGRSSSAPSPHGAWLPGLLVALGASGCRASPGEEPPRVDRERGEWPAPVSTDTGDHCADLRDTRVCWMGGRASVQRAPLPLPGATPASLRCFGRSAERRCVERYRDAPRFRCTGVVCEQPHPRVPDHGEWECADLGGVVACHGGDAAAGVAPAGADPSFVCGARRGMDGGNERVCLDYSPDLPDMPGAYRCRFERKPALVRVCTRGDDVHASGDACDKTRPCLSGLACASGRCVPPAPPPTCWLDADCPPDAPCRFGACVKGAP